MELTGLIGGNVGYLILRRLSRHRDIEGHCSGAAYKGVSKLEALFGPQIWQQVAGRTVIDFGCGAGDEVVDLASHQAARVIGIDIRENALRIARSAAEKAGVAERCAFALDTDERADVIVSVDSFEHYDDPPHVLRTMRRLLKDDGRLLIVFGPPWYHPYGGHLFSLFPWAHLLFTERALLRWRADFKTDGATRFREVEGGLNQMTIRRFQAVIKDSDFEIERLDLAPIKKLKSFHNPFTRELLTSVVRCQLAPKRIHGATRSLGRRLRDDRDELPSRRSKSP